MVHTQEEGFPGLHSDHHVHVLALVIFLRYPFHFAWLIEIHHNALMSVCTESLEAWHEVESCCDRIHFSVR